MLKFGPDIEREHALWKTHMAVGRIAYEDGYYSASIRNYLSALASAEILNLVDEYKSQTLLGLARSYVEVGQYSQAEKLYRSVLQMDELAANQYDLSIDLNDLAVLYCRTGKDEKAEELLRQSLAIFESAGDADALDLATTLKNLAHVCCKQNRFADSEKYIHKAFTLCDTGALRRTKLAAEIFVVKSLIAAKQGLLAEAEDLIQQAIPILELVTGGEHPQLADFLDLAAEILRKEGLPDQALPLVERANAIRLRVKIIDR